MGITMLYENTYYGISGLGDDILFHHGIKGQKWGVRRFQYGDGLLTPAGRARYNVGPREKSGGSHSNYKKGKKGKKGLTDRQRKIAKAVGVGVAVAGTAIAAKKLKDMHIEKKALRTKLLDLDFEAQLRMTNGNTYDHVAKLTPLAGRSTSRMSRNELKKTTQRTKDLIAALKYQEAGIIDMNVTLDDIMRRNNS